MGPAASHPKEVTMTETFIDELLRETEQKEEQERLEMDRLTADKLLMAIAAIETSTAEVNELADSEVKLIEEYRARELARLEKKRTWLTFNLENFMRGTGEKTLRLPHGVLKLRSSRERVTVAAMDLFLSVAGRLGLLRKIPETYALDLPAVLDYVRRTGEVPPGVELIPSEVRFTYSTAKGGQDDHDQTET